MISVTNEDGRKFNVNLVLPGGRYGNAHMKDSQGRLPCVNDSDDLLVEFYDAKQEGNPAFDPDLKRGQFASRYYLHTLIDSAAKIAEYGIGLDLDGGVPVWRVSAENVRQVIAYAEAVKREHQLLAGVT